MKDLRLDKFLTEMGKGSRSQVKTYISKGRVTVNGEIIKRPEYKISPEKDIVNLEGEKVNYSQWEYYMLNKPAGCSFFHRRCCKKRFVSGRQTG